MFPHLLLKAAAISRDLSFVLRLYSATERCAATTHSLAESLTFLRRHLFPALSYAVAPAAITATGVSMEPAEEDFGKQK